MTMLEKKIDVLIRAVASEDEISRKKAVEEAKAFCLEQDANGGADTIKVYAEDILLEVGIPASLKGYRALVEAICMGVENPPILEQITKRLYPEVAKKIDSTAQRTERAIRHAVEVAASRCDLDVWNSYFGNSMALNKGKPTNSEFIARMVIEVGHKI